MTRGEIIDLIRTQYDPEPKDWPRHRGWDDGAGDIADEILRRFGRPGASDLMQKFDAAIEAIKNA